MAEILQTFLIAMTPIGELRAAIPIALGAYKLNWVLAYIISVLGNLVPAALILLFLKGVSAWLSERFKIFENFFNWLFNKTEKKHRDKIKKYGAVALISFVAIPLPMTGAWTASLVAFLFKIPFKKAFPWITAGVAIAGIIVLALSKAGITLFKFL